jgi:leukotriene-A4 hydrolase
MILRPLILVAFVNLCALAQPPDSLRSPQSTHSYARPSEVVSRHLDLDLQFDFQAKTLTGRATHFIQNKTNATQFRLDTRGLVIKRVALGSKHERTTFSLGTASPTLGQELIVDITPETKSVTVWYTTSGTDGALQWLDAQQTGDKHHPFVYTQSQPIRARTWIPCQDDPAVRITYRATVKVPAQMMAVMSAENPTTQNARGSYEFYMSQPIPSYLIALAAGNLTFRSLGSRTGVYAEPGMIEKAAHEFADTESMMVAAEQMYGPYRWRRYDMLVLPPAFPIGGMENPRITFLTPTVIAGDRSLVSLVAHELAHSWSGNLVTNETWNDIWLNEGMTTYIENRIVERVYGRAQSEMQAYFTVREVNNDITSRLGIENPNSRLRPDFTGQNLEDVMSGVPYGKGYLFLRTLEEAVGRDEWDAFLKGYFDRFAFQTMSTAAFLDYMKANVHDWDSVAARVPIQQWVYGPGLPPPSSLVRPPQFDSVEAFGKALVDGTRSAIGRPDGYSAFMIRHLLQSLPRPLPETKMRELDEMFELTRSQNAEILVEWLQLAIASWYQPAFPALERFVTSVGRLRYLRPIYALFMETDRGRAEAHRLYDFARPGYHVIASRPLDKLVHPEP